MANYAYIEGFEIVELHDSKPNNWRNISNFMALNDDEMVQFGWKKVQKLIPENFNVNTQQLMNERHYILNDVVYEEYDVVDIPLPVTEVIPEIPEEILLINQWNQVRTTRDQLMKDFEWRYTRYERQTRLGVPTTDNIENLDNYMQALADITLQTNPYEIAWPSFTG